MPARGRRHPNNSFRCVFRCGGRLKRAHDDNTHDLKPCNVLKVQRKTRWELQLRASFPLYGATQPRRALLLLRLP